MGLSKEPGVCFNKHDRLSNQATDHPPMLIVISRTVHHPVRRSIMLIETAPCILVNHHGLSKNPYF